jgi:hypothetical protein
MRARFGFARLTAAAVAAWVSCASPALPCDGAPFVPFQSVLDGVCGLFDIVPGDCPQVPTITQAILEISALFGARPEAVRHAVDGTGEFLPGGTINAGNNQQPVDCPPNTAGTVALSSLTPLAFVSAQSGQGPAAPTQLYDHEANSFFYAVTTVGCIGAQPHTLNLIFDYLPRVVPIFLKGQDVAKISLPLVVLNPDGSERSVCGANGCPASLATLRIGAACTGGPACVTDASVVGDFSGDGKQVSYNAADLGVTITVTFSPSPLSRVPHAIFRVRVPLVVTVKNDRVYVGASSTALDFPFFPFLEEEHGFPAKVLGKNVGIAPYAAPQCPNGLPCNNPLLPDPPTVSTFPFCASFSTDLGGTSLKPAVAAFLAIGTDGEALVSAPFAASPTVQCPS